MKLEIYNDKDVDQERVVRLRLIESNSHTGIILTAVDERGNRLDQGNLFIVHKSGKTSLPYRVDPKLGLELNAHSQLAVDGDGSI